MNNRKLAFVISTLLLIVLIMLSQFLSRYIPQISVGSLPLPLNQLVAGSLINLILIIGAYLPGLAAAGTAAIISPVLLSFFGFGIGIYTGGFMPQMIPVVMAGNLTLVFMTWICFRASNGLENKGVFILNVIGIFIGAVLKSLVMWGAAANIVVPVFHVSAGISSQIEASVSTPQFLTALIGGALALLIMPSLRRFKKGKKKYK